MQISDPDDLYEETVIGFKRWTSVRIKNDKPITFDNLNYFPRD